MAVFIAFRVARRQLGDLRSDGQIIPALSVAGSHAGSPNSLRRSFSVVLAGFGPRDSCRVRRYTFHMRLEQWHSRAATIQQAAVRTAPGAPYRQARHGGVGPGPGLLRVKFIGPQSVGWAGNLSGSGTQKLPSIRRSRVLSLLIESGEAFPITAVPGGPPTRPRCPSVLLRVCDGHESWRSHNL